MANSAVSCFGHCSGYSRKCMFLRPTLHPSIFLVVGCNGAILVSRVPMMTLLVVYTDE